MIGVYIHIPFCLSKCPYCDFTSFANQEALFEAYKNALVNEIRQSGALQTRTMDTVFFGGGTPTALPVDYLDEIMDTLSRFALTHNVEITMEANPGTLDKRMLKSLKQMGVNRLSMGLQAWQPHLLAQLGRVHTRELFLHNYNDAICIGMSNINIDLMFALPGQTLDDWYETLGHVTALSPAHISAYGLTIADDTSFGRRLRHGGLCLPDENTERAMYDMAKAMIKQNKYEHYEISNYAKPGFAARHNKRYWEREEVVGFGLSAHALLGDERYANTHDLDRYIHANGDPSIIRAVTETVSQQQAMEEWMFLGLRLTEGVSAQRFYKLFGKHLYSVFKAPIEKYVRLGYITADNGRVALTGEGHYVSNIILADFLL